ncbi:hypothetical protein BBJ29_007338 [Phytophthora kernoviae]|uniref:Uncharacterized protein n=1 Tax=Phytophthora kernoviae TaxID=325452 RepID=A0A3R7HLQ5_9STRA|nr:hypothetical protein BBJ29_007338 [Phytophthora kernoviae]
MRKSAAKDIKMQEKATQKEVKRIENLVTRGYTPERLATKLGFTKLDDVTKDKNYGFYTNFGGGLAWMLGESDYFIG